MNLSYEIIDARRELIVSRQIALESWPHAASDIRSLFDACIAMLDVMDAIIPALTVNASISVADKLYVQLWDAITQYDCIPRRNKVWFTWRDECVLYKGHREARIGDAIRANLFHVFSIMQDKSLHSTLVPTSQSRDTYPGHWFDSEGITAIQNAMNCGNAHPTA